jgi:hypothetical protein
MFNFLPYRYTNVAALMGGGGDPTPGSDDYLRPDGTSYYNRPDGTSYYTRP